MEPPEVASAAGGDASRRPALPPRPRRRGLGFPRPPGGPRGRYLGGRLRSLDCPQVLVQLGAQLGQLSLQQDLGAGCAERLGPGARWGAGSVPRGALGRAKVRCEKPNGNTSKRAALG